MRIAVTKQLKHLQEANYTHFSGGTVGDVWYEDESSFHMLPAIDRERLTGDKSSLVSH